MIPELFQRKNSGGSPVELLRALQLNAYQLGQLLCRMVPDLPQYLDNSATQSSLSDTDGHIGKLYNRAVIEHKKFLTSSSENMTIAEHAAKNYLKVNNEVKGLSFFFNRMIITFGVIIIFFYLRTRTVLFSLSMKRNHN